MSSGKPSNCPPTLPPLLRNSAMLRSLKSRSESISSPDMTSWWHSCDAFWTAPIYFAAWSSRSSTTTIHRRLAMSSEDRRSATLPQRELCPLAHHLEHIETVDLVQRENSFRSSDPGHLIG